MKKALTFWVGCKQNGSGALYTFVLRLYFKLLGVNGIEDEDDDVGQGTELGSSSRERKLNWNFPVLFQHAGMLMHFPALTGLAKNTLGIFIPYIFFKN